MAKKEKNIQFPSVLAYAKKIVPSNGLMFSCDWNNRKDDICEVITKTIRGSWSSRLKESEMNKSTDSNIQTIDSAYLNIGQDTLHLKYSIKFLGGIGTPSSCDNADFMTASETIFNEFAKHDSLKTLAYRYVYNIANARALWRNRLGCLKIETVITLENKEQFVFNSLELPTDKFIEDANIQKIADYIYKTLASYDDSFILNVDTYALIGEEQEVYPSEEFVQEKSKKVVGSKTKTLYSIVVDGKRQAGIHSQKIGNAIRTIDTWHGKDCVIPIEVYGTVSSNKNAYRINKNDFYTIYDNMMNNFMENNEIPTNINNNEEYLLAMLIRGGVFGKKE